MKSEQELLPEETSVTDMHRKEFHQMTKWTLKTQSSKFSIVSKIDVVDLQYQLS